MNEVVIMEDEEAGPEHLKETVEEVSEKVKADLSAGALKQLLIGHELDFESMVYVEAEPVYSCDKGSVLQNNTCG
jgi:hypothetical protein